MVVFHADQEQRAVEPSAIFEWSTNRDCLSIDKQSRRMLLILKGTASEALSECAQVTIPKTEKWYQEWERLCRVQCLL